MTIDDIILRQPDNSSLQHQLNMHISTSFFLVAFTLPHLQLLFARSRHVIIFLSNVCIHSDYLDANEHYFLYFHGHRSSGQNCSH